jgi:glutaminyl-peptide cyclotransferase
MVQRNFLICVLLVISVQGCKQGDSASSANPAGMQSAQSSASPQPAGPALHIDPDRAMQYVKDIVEIGPRWPGSRGQQRMADYLCNKLKADHPMEDVFAADTPAGKLPVRNIVARFQGAKDGIIVLGSHIDTNYPLRNTNYVGANDGASSTALLLAIADQLRGKKLEGYSVWLAFFDGEEAIEKWTETDSTYGSRHLAAKWQQDGTIPKIKAFLLADMIGDADLNIEHDLNSTPWLEDLVLNAAQRLGYQSHFFDRQGGIEDDHLSFAHLGVPVADIIDLDYGYNNSYHHTTQDTIDKLSPRSLQISGDVILETIRLVNGRH